MLENFRPQTPKRNCKVRTIWETLDEADREIFMRNLSDSSISSKSLERAFKEVGIDLGDTALNHHRKGLCSCSRI